MSMTSGPIHNQRRVPRKRANFTCAVTDVVSGQCMGHLGDLSTHGLMLICQQAPQDGAIHQLRLALQQGAGAAPTGIEVGAQVIWHRAASSPGQVWVGFRTIAISDTDAATLDAWLMQPE